MNEKQASRFVRAELEGCGSVIITATTHLNEHHKMKQVYRVTLFEHGVYDQIRVVGEGKTAEQATHDAIKKWRGDS